MLVAITSIKNGFLQKYNIIPPPRKHIYYALIFIYNIFNNNIKVLYIFFNIKVEYPCVITGIKYFQTEYKKYIIY